MQGENLKEMGTQMHKYTYIQTTHREIKMPNHTTYNNS